MNAFVLSLIVIVTMMNRKSFRRQKVNCLCRCTPQTGIETLSTPLVRLTRQQAIDVVATSRSTSVIAATALRAGRIFEQLHMPYVALTLYRTAILRIQRIDYDRAEDYYTYGPLPPNPYYRPWSARINDADALEIAQQLDALYHHLHLPGYAHQCRLVNTFYERMFRSVYSACL